MKTTDRNLAKQLPFRTISLKCDGYKETFRVLQAYDLFTIDYVDGWHLVFHTAQTINGMKIQSVEIVIPFDDERNFATDEIFAIIWVSDDVIYRERKEIELKCR